MSTQPPRPLGHRRDQMMLSDRMREAYRLYCDGQSYNAISRGMGVAVNTIYRWVARVHEADREQRRMRA